MHKCCVWVSRLRRLTWQTKEQKHSQCKGCILNPEIAYMMLTWVWFEMLFYCMHHAKQWLELWVDGTDGQEQCLAALHSPPSMSCCQQWAGMWSCDPFLYTRWRAGPGNPPHCCVLAHRVMFGVTPPQRLPFDCLMQTKCAFSLPLQTHVPVFNTL